MLYICHQVHLLVSCEWQPLRHIGIDQTATDCVVQIFVSGQSASGCGTALELAESEVPRLRLKLGQKKSRVFSPFNGVKWVCQSSAIQPRIRFQPR